MYVVTLQMFTHSSENEPEELQNTILTLTLALCLFYDFADYINKQQITARTVFLLHLTWSL